MATKRAAVTPSKSGVSLNEAHRRLEEALGADAPARITLHRHSKDGDLRRMVLRKTKAGRSYYDDEALIEYYRPALLTITQSRESEQRAPARPPRGAPAQAQSATQAAQPPQERIDTKALAAQLILEAAPLIERQVAVALEPIAGVLARLDRGLSDLSATRTSLMLKYDAAANLGNQRLEAAQAEVARLKAAESLEQQISRIRLDIGRLIQTVSLLEPRQT